MRQTPALLNLKPHWPLVVQGSRDFTLTSVGLVKLLSLSESWCLMRITWTLCMAYDYYQSNGCFTGFFIFPLLGVNLCSMWILSSSFFYFKNAKVLDLEWILVLSNQFQEETFKHGARNGNHGNQRSLSEALSRAGRLCVTFHLSFNINSHIYLDEHNYNLHLTWWDIWRHHPGLWRESYQHFYIFRF